MCFLMKPEKEISLTKAAQADAGEIYEMQIKSFAALLEKYRDYDSSPGAEGLERTEQRLAEKKTDYYFISAGGLHVGALRMCNFGKLCKLKQLFILPEYQNQGFAQQAVKLCEALYPKAECFELDTILQEKQLCYLYEKLGYRKTGETQSIKDGMDLVFYRKPNKNRLT